jgi:UDPglucose 6-dehydrogenase
MNLLVVGLGKLGLPLCAILAESGHQVIGVDKSEELVKSLNSREFHSAEPRLRELLVRNYLNLTFSNSYDDFMEKIDVIFIIVPTPSDSVGRFSNSILVEALKEVVEKIKYKQNHTVIDIVSTVMPGTCDGIIRETIESISGQKLGSKISLCYNPEFIALGSVINDMQYPDMHLLGCSNDRAGDLVQSVLSSMVLKPVPCKRLNLLEAEIVKISINNYVTMKISFANSLMQLAESLGNVDIDKVTNAIGMDSRIGSKYMRAAAPYGGPCFPRDTRAMTFLFDSADIPWSLSSTTENLNKNHVRFIAQKIISVLPLGAKVGLLGISYKSGTSVTDESTGVLIAHELMDKSVKVVTWDDENAEVPGRPDLKRDLNAILNEADFFVITRPLAGIASIVQTIDERGKEFMDLWRQVN